ncbi:hypothetical protein ACLOJK_000009 [Asimina triloba]
MEANNSCKWEMTSRWADEQAGWRRWLAMAGVIGGGWSCWRRRPMVGWRMEVVGERVVPDKRADGGLQGRTVSHGGGRLHCQQPISVQSTTVGGPPNLNPVIIPSAACGQHGTKWSAFRLKAWQNGGPDCIIFLTAMRSD